MVTRVCTGELAALRDDLGSFQNDDVQLLAVSCDAPATQRVFAEQQRLGSPVLSDFWPHGEAADRYGVFNPTVGAALRGTFVIDKAGMVRYKVVNELPEARDPRAYRAALAAL